MAQNNQFNADKIEQLKKYYNEIAINKELLSKSEKDKAEKDKYGNLKGNQFDLAKDNSFTGETIAVLHLYTGEGFDFKLPEQALKEKGFKIYRWVGLVPNIAEFKDVLKMACQLWVISSNTLVLSDQHIQAIKEFFDNKKGVYIWGDNDPFFADANKIAGKLFGGSMSGDVYGNQVVYEQKQKKCAGFVKDHPVTTGIDFLYEGITIATIRDNPHLDPIVYGSANNLVTAVYDKNGKRAIIDGGFTRLFTQWDSAGTGRYVKNAAAYLVNIENRK